MAVKKSQIILEAEGMLKHIVPTFKEFEEAFEQDADGNWVNHYLTDVPGYSAQPDQTNDDWNSQQNDDNAFGNDATQGAGETSDGFGDSGSDAGAGSDTTGDDFGSDTSSDGFGGDAQGGFGDESTQDSGDGFGQDGSQDSGQGGGDEFGGGDEGGEGGDDWGSSQGGDEGSQDSGQGGDDTSDSSQGGQEF